MSERTWLVVWIVDDSRLTVQAHEEPRVSAAVQQWCDSGGTRDNVLTMDGLGGRTVNYLVSQVAGWMLSTPEHRRCDLEQEARDRDERRGFRQAAGLPFDDDAA